MSVRPVDLQTMLPRLGEAGRQQHHADTQPYVAQHALTAKEGERVERQQRQVHHKEPSEQARVGGEGGGGGGSARQQEHRRENGQEEKRADGTAPPGVGHRLDVKM